MMAQATAREIQDRLDIVEVIGSTVPLRRAGQNFKGLCPFHPEKTPSFVIYPQKQFFICYGCGAGGDLIAFVMKHEHLEFQEALELLAQKAGVEVAPAGRRGSGKELSELYRAHEVATGLYERLLAESSEAAPARAYLDRRGLKPESWKAFHLGYAPNRWDALLEAAEREGVPGPVLERAGLAVPREGRQGWYDRFRDRLIFPIADPRGRVIGFGGRVLEDAEGPKYMNSPETELYVKGKILYGLNLAAPEIRQKDFCIVVEGYMDLVTPYQHGIRNVAASMGTSLTESQVRLIRRFTRHVVMVYDGDYAGQAATLRGLDLFLEAEMRVRVAVLPGGADPDSLIRSRGVEAFAQVLQQSQELFDHKLGFLARQFEPRTLEGRIRICQEMLPTIKRVPNALRRGEYIRRLAELLGLEEGPLWAELARVRLARSQAAWRPERLSEVPAAARPGMDAEGLLAGLLLEEPARIEQVVGRLELDDLRLPEARRIMGWLLERRKAGALPADHREVLSALPRDPSGETQALLARWLAWADSMQEKERVMDGVVERIREGRRRASLQSLTASLREAEAAGDSETAAQLLSEINRMVRKTQVQGATAREQ